MGRIASAHATVILLLVLGAFVYRDVVPLGTFTTQPMDGADGWITWLRIALLGLAGALVPLCLPRTFKPVDPSVSPLDIFNGLPSDYEHRVPAHLRQSRPLHGFPLQHLGSWIPSSTKRIMRLTFLTRTYPSLPTTIVRTISWR